ncbi:hypothetical protein HDK77DRAFT_509096 [Phyllosticta capitalensis]
MQRNPHGTAGATANDYSAPSSKSSSPRRVNFDLTPNKKPNWQQNTTSPLSSPRGVPPSIPYCDLAIPQSKHGHGLGEPSRTNSPNHSRRRWAELCALARNSLVTLESARKGTSSSSSTPPPPSPQKTHSPAPKSPLKPCLKSPTSPTFAPQLPPPAPVPPPPRTPRRTAWRSQVAPSLPTLVEVSSAASGGKSDNASRASKSGKSSQVRGGRPNRPRASTGRNGRHERYEMERMKRTRESGGRVSQTNKKNAHGVGSKAASKHDERRKREPKIDAIDSELSNTSKSSRGGGKGRVTKSKDATKHPPRPPLTRRDALLEAMRVEDPPAPPLASSSVYSSSECSSPSIYTSSSVYSSSTATPESPTTSTDRSSPPSTPMSKRTASTEPTSYTSGSETTSPPKTPLTPTSPTKTMTSQTVTEMESEAESAQTETVEDSASCTHRTVSSVALGSALGLTKPSSAVRSVMGLERCEMAKAREPLIGETGRRKSRKTTEDRKEEKDERRATSSKSKEEVPEPPPPPKPQPRVRKRKQARFPEVEEAPAKDLKKTVSDPGERHHATGRMTAEDRPRRDGKDGSSKGGRKRVTTKPSAAVEKENKDPEPLDAEGEAQMPRRHVSHSIKSRRSVCVRGQGMHLYIDMAHKKPSSTTSTTTNTTANPPPLSPHHYHRPILANHNSNSLQVPATIDDDATSCISSTSLHPGVDLSTNAANPKNLAFKNPFAPPPPPDQMRYTRPVRRPYRWPRLDRGFDGVAGSRPPLDLGKALPPIPAGDSEDEYPEDEVVFDKTRSSHRQRQRPRRGSGGGLHGPRPGPLPRRLSLSLSALPDTPFLGALDVSRLAVGEERVFRLPDPPTASAVERAAAQTSPRHQASAPAQRSAAGAWEVQEERAGGNGTARARTMPARRRTDADVGERARARARGKGEADYEHEHPAMDADAPNHTQTQPQLLPPPRVRDGQKNKTKNQEKETPKQDPTNDTTTPEVEIDGIARRLAFAIKNGRAKGTRAVKDQPAAAAGDSSHRLPRRSNLRLPAQAHKVGTTVSIAQDGEKKDGVVVVVDARLRKEQRTWEYKVEDASQETEWVREEDVVA